MTRQKKKHPKTDEIKMGIDAYLRKNPLSYRQLAELMGVNYLTLLQVLNDQVSMSDKTYYRIEKFLEDYKQQLTLSKEL